MRLTTMGLIAAASVALACSKGEEKAPVKIDSIVPAPAPAAPAPAAPQPAAPAPVAAPKPTPAAAPAVSSAKGVEMAKISLHATGTGPKSLAVTRADGAGGENAVWVESTEAGAKAANIVVDPVNHMAFAFLDATIACKNGSKVRAHQMAATYGDNNSFNEPVGSGWYGVRLEAGMCGATEQMAWGFQFGADGKVTKEGPAKIDPSTGDPVFEEAAPAKAP